MKVSNQKKKIMSKAVVIFEVISVQVNISKQTVYDENEKNLA